MNNSNAVSPHVLVVDDHLPNIDVLRSFLEREGYRVLPATSGEQALDIARERRPDLILLDVLMPEMDGFTICRILKSSEETRSIPVILVTALQDPEHVVRGLEAGADDFVSKPFIAAELLARVRAHLRTKALHDELARQLDISQRQHAELQRLETLKEALTEMIVHDLNNPVTSILGNLELIRQLPPALSTPQAEALEAAINSTKRLMRMIRNLIDLRHLEDGQWVLQRSPVDIQELVRGVLADLDIPHMKPELSVEVAVAPATLWLDRYLIERVLANLLDNAVKYTRSGGKVKVEGEPAEKCYRLSVSDQGPALPEALRERIFEPAAQLEARDAGLPRGITLGLTFAKLAVEAHGGRMYVEPHEGAGNRFVVELPLRPL